MTLALMERYMQSEVENLHFRIDDLFVYVKRVDERLATVERQQSLLYLAVEDLKVAVGDLKVAVGDLKVAVEDLKIEVAFIKENFATKDDLRALFEQYLPRAS